MVNRYQINGMVSVYSLCRPFKLEKSFNVFFAKRVKAEKSENNLPHDFLNIMEILGSDTKMASSFILKSILASFIDFENGENLLFLFV